MVVTASIVPRHRFIAARLSIPAGVMDRRRCTPQVLDMAEAPTVNTMPTRITEVRHAIKRNRTNITAITPSARTAMADGITRIETFSLNSGSN